MLPYKDKEGLIYTDALRLADMQVPKSERKWVTTVPRDQRERDFILYLGCHVLKTSHLIETTIKILERMGVDFLAVAGPQNCCGIRDYEQGDRWQTDTTIASLSSLAREKVLMWCPSCNFHISRIVKNDNVQAGFGIEHASQFISDHIDRIEFQGEIHARVALHKHTGSQQQDLDARYAERILGAIPGLKVVQVDALAELGRHCSNNAIEKLTEERYLQLIRRTLDEAKEEDVEILATIYHSCQREICGEESRFPLMVENYLTILGRAMGIEVEDKFKRWKLMRDPEKIIEDAKDCISANNLSLDKIRETISRNF
ncbi:MAG: heterodisulfide reductase-related iron-sulfur binding cluster [Candidatus Binatia bacterium]